MNYVKIFRAIDYSEAEKLFNDFLAEVARKGHRVMHAKYEVELNEITAVFTINSEPHPHKKPI